MINSPRSHQDSSAMGLGKQGRTHSLLPISDCRFGRTRCLSHRSTTSRSITVCYVDACPRRLPGSPRRGPQATTAGPRAPRSRLRGGASTPKRFSILGTNRRLPHEVRRRQGLRRPQRFLREQIHLRLVDTTMLASARATEARAIRPASWWSAGAAQRAVPPC